MARVKKDRDNKISSPVVGVLIVLSISEIDRELHLGFRLSKLAGVMLCWAAWLAT